MAIYGAYRVKGDATAIIRSVSSVAFSIGGANPFERAVQAAQNAKDVESLRIGIEFIAQQLQETLRTQGVAV